MISDVFVFLILALYVILSWVEIARASVIRASRLWKEMLP